MLPSWGWRGGDFSRRVKIGEDLEVVLGDAGERVVPRLASRPLSDGAPFVVSDHGTYVISGGTGGIGLVTARWLVERGARHVALLSRSGQLSGGGGQADWDFLMGHGSVEVVCLRCDVSDEASVVSALGEVRQRMPPICGVVHSAGVLDDGAMANMSRERFERVFVPKVDAAWHLHRHTLGD